MLKSFAYIVFGICYLYLGSCYLFMQELETFSIEKEQPGFFMDLVKYKSINSDTGRLDVYILVPYEKMLFLKKGEIFTTEYELTLNIFDSLGNLVAEKLWTEKVQRKTYEETVSKYNGRISQKSFFLKSGTYNVIAQLRDPETKKHTEIQRKCTFLPSLSTEIDFSDFILVNKLEKRGDETYILPNISGVISEGVDHFFLFFEIYNQTKLDSIKIIIRIKNKDGSTIKEDSSLHGFSNQVSSCFFKINSKNLHVGEYHIEAYVFTPDDSVGKKMSAEKTFIIRWRGLPTSIVDLDKAIDQMQYVAPAELIKKMKSADLDEKRKMFLDFWQERDPTPNTEYNELLEEYYSRVAYSNQNFGHYQSGWKTDRGMIYIIFGAPNSIERYPFEMDRKPYEIWTYYSINKQFVFVDVTGFGDYRLRSPIWDNENFRYR